MTETIYVNTTPIASDDTVFCDQITISGSGVTVQGSNVANANGFLITLNPKSDFCWMFPHDSDSTHGFPINTEDHIVLSVSNLTKVDFSCENGEGSICWLKL